MTTPILEIRNLYYSYKSDWLFKRTQVLHGVSLSIEAGEAFGFLGPNGAGKTTTIKCILALIRPDSGDVMVDGRSNLDSDSRANIGYLPEHPYFYDHLTVTELVEMYAVLAGIPRSQINSSVQKALDLVNISFKSKSPLRTLSKGLMQRVGMAQAIVARPKLLVLDEPFSGLDPIGRKEFRELLFSLKESGTSIFMSSHILSDVEYLCDRASILIEGDLKGIFNLKDLKERSSGIFSLALRNFESAKEVLSTLASDISVKGETLHVEFAGRDNAQKALSTAISSGAVVESFEENVESLEDIFMQLVDKSKGEALQR